MLIGVVRMVLDFSYKAPLCTEEDTRPWIVGQVQGLAHVRGVRGDGDDGHPAGKESIYHPRRPRQLSAQLSPWLEGSFINMRTKNHINKTTNLDFLLVLLTSFEY